MQNVPLPHVQAHVQAQSQAQSQAIPADPPLPSKARDTGSEAAALARIRFLPMDSATAYRLRHGGTDAYGLAPERVRAEGRGNPCRHCLAPVPEGAEMLICAHRPFDALQPYAETGPVFLCAADCAPWAPDPQAGADRSGDQNGSLPPAFRLSPEYLLKGYGHDQRIRYGSGRVVAQGEIGRYALSLLGDPAIAFVDLRSARNNCWQARLILSEVSSA